MSRNSFFWTTSKIALFLILALGLRPMEAAEYHIGSGEPDDATHFSTLEALYNAHSILNGDTLIFHQDSYTLTNFGSFTVNGTVDLQIADSLTGGVTINGNSIADRLFTVNGTLNIAPDFTFANFNSAHNGVMTAPANGNINAAGVGFVNNTSGSGAGAIDTSAWNPLYNGDVFSGHNRINLRGTYFEGNSGYGGATGMWDAEVDYTDAVFINNTGWNAGAIQSGDSTNYPEITTVALGAEADSYSLFAGNYAMNLDRNVALYFTGTWLAGTTTPLMGYVDVNISTGDNAVLDLLDPIYIARETRGDNYSIFECNIVKTGSGTWNLGGVSVVDTGQNTTNEATITIEKGVLRLLGATDNYETAYGTFSVLAAELRMTGDNDVFTIMPGATVEVMGGNVIQGTTVTFEDDAILSFVMDAFFRNPTDPNYNPRNKELLYLHGDTLKVDGTLVRVEFPDDLTFQEKKGDYMLILGSSDFTADNFTLTVNGERITNDRYGYKLNQEFGGNFDSKTLVLNVDETKNTVLRWNNAAGNNQWSFDAKTSANFYDEYVNDRNDSFITNDSVIFDLSGSHSINVVGDMVISKDAHRPTGDFNTGERGMRVSGNGNWTFNGGSIGDGYNPATNRDFLGALVFDGTGILTLKNDNPNDYHDGTYISGGGTIVAKGVHSLGSSEYAGYATTGRRVQDEGYGILFSNNGGIIQFQTGTIFDPETQLPISGVLDQRISVASNSSGAIELLGKNQTIVVTANSAYQSYATDTNGGAVNVGQNGAFHVSGSFVFAQNTSKGNGGAIFADSSAAIDVNGTHFLKNTAAQYGGGIYHAGGSTGLLVTLAVNNSFFGAATDDTVGNTAQDGGAIYLANGGNMLLRVTGSGFYDNRATTGSGGAISVGNNASAALDIVSFIGNRAARNGGAVSMGIGSVFSAKSANFQSNTAALGGAVYHAGNGSSRQALSMLIDGSYFGSLPTDSDDPITTGNTAESGGAIYVGAGYNMTLNIIDSAFFGNKATTGDGGAVYTGADLNVISSNTLFRANEAKVAGGAIRLGNGTTFAMKNNDFLSNTATDGGALYVGENAMGKAEFVNFTGNTATGYGGAVYLGNGNAFDAISVYFRNNESKRGGAVYHVGNSASATVGVSFENTFFGTASMDEEQSYATGNTAERGGALYIHDGSRINLEIAGSGFYGNTATVGQGGALYVGAGSNAAMVGFELALDEVVFESNTAQLDGGAVYTVDYSTDNTFSATNVTFSNNKSLAGNGGAVRVGVNAVLTGFDANSNETGWSGVKFQNNEAEKGSGGALSLGDGSTLTFVAAGTGVSEFIDNTAARSGGAVYFEASGLLDAAYVTFRNNTATAGAGGAIATGQGTMITLGNAVSFQENLAGTTGGAIDMKAGSTLNITGNTTFIGNNAGQSGGAVNMLDNANLTVNQKTSFTNNTAETLHGGAIFLGNNSWFHSQNGVTFTGNKAGGDGGAIRIGDGTNSMTGLEAWGTTFTQNVAGGDGGAIRVGTGTADAVMLVDLYDASVSTKSVFDRNTAGAFGGAISGGDFVHLDAERAEFKDNTAVQSGGAIRLGNNANLEIWDAIFTSNRFADAKSEGGAIYLGDHAMIYGNGATFTGNGADRTGTSPKATGLYGGAIRVGIDSELHLDGSAFRQNMLGAANSRGGAIYAGAGTRMTAKRAAFENNTAQDSGGAVYLASSASTIPVMESNFHGATFQANTAQSGNGGALWMGASDDIILTETRYANNRAGTAGGAVYYDGGQTVTASGASFTGNSAGTTGGAMHLQRARTLNIADASFTSNVATGVGGALHAAIALRTVDAEGANFASNVASQGGAVYLGRAGGTTMFNGAGSEFASNTARGGSGGAIYAVDTDFDLYGSHFRNNAATAHGGAIYYETSGGNRSLKFGVDEGQIAGFSANTAGSVSSAIHFVGKGEAPSEITMSVEANGTFELLDAMTIDKTYNNVKLGMTKTGLGTMLFGGVHDLRSASQGASMTIEEGTLDMQNGGALLLTCDGGWDLFEMQLDTELIVRGRNEITATSITLADKLGFDLNNILPNSDTVALTLDGRTNTASGGAIGSGVINIVDFVELSGYYNLVRAENARFADTGTLQYKGVNITNNDRLVDYWDLHVDTETSTLQLELRPWENTTLTWTGEVDGKADNTWNIETRNWTGYSEGIPVNQFIDADSVIFTDQGAGVVNVSPNDVVVNSMEIKSDTNYDFQGGAIIGNTLKKLRGGDLTMSTRFEFDDIYIHDGTVLGGIGSDYTVVGNLHFMNGTQFLPTDKFRVDGNFSMHGGSRAQLELGAAQSNASAVMVTGTIDFGTGGGTTVVFVDNNGLSSGQYGSDSPIFVAEAGLTLDGESIADGIYGVSHRVIEIVGGNGALALESDRSLALQAAVIQSDSTGSSTEFSLIAFGTGFGADGPTSSDFNVNQLAIYEALENAPYQSVANTFFAELAKLGSVSEKAEALDSMLGSVNAGAMLVAERNLLRIGSTIYQRVHLLTDMREGGRHYEDMFGQSASNRGANFSPWFTNLGDFQDQNDSRAARGFKSKMYGFMLGVDRSLNRETLFGLGLSGTFASVESGKYQNAKADTYMISVYGAYVYDDWTVIGNAGYASSEFNFKRNVFTVSTETKLRGDSVTAGAEVSKKLRSGSLDYRPYASLQLVSMDLGTYTDRSLGVMGDVKISWRDSYAALQTFGVRISREFTGPLGAVWIPTFNAGWLHDYGRGNIRSTTTFAGSTPFTVIGAERARDRILVGLGTNVAYEHVTFFSSFDGEFSGRYASQTLQLGFNFVF